MPSSSSWGKTVRGSRNRRLVVVAEGVLGFQVQVEAVARLVALQRLLDLGEQVAAADQELHGLLQPVEFLAQRVLEVQVRATTQCDVISIGECRTHAPWTSPDLPPCWAGSPPSS